MEKVSLYTVYLIGFFLAELLYFKVAKLFKIYAIPNHRSAHSQVTIIGGGILISIACLLYGVSSHFQYPFFIAGILLISIVCFIDDVKEISITLRLLAQLAAALLIIYQLGAYSNGIVIVLSLIGLMIISVNAYNFIDGINGMMSAYSLILIGSLFYINQYYVTFVDEPLLIIIGIALAVFGYFNFRTKARCFAGDVGSIGMAFIVCFCILKLIFKTQNLLFINFLLLYYLDAISTFIFRWLQGENVLEAHKKHFYLYLVYVQKWPHLLVAAFYAGIQLVINILIINSLNVRVYTTGYYNLPYAILFIAINAVLFVSIRIQLEGKQLYKKRDNDAGIFNPSAARERIALTNNRMGKMNFKEFKP